MVGTMDERIPAEKRRVRAEMRVVRAQIAADPADRSARSARIWPRIVSMLGLGAERLGSGTERAQNKRRIMLYDALAGEPDSHPWMEWCRAHGLEVFTPRVDGPDLHVEPGDVDPASLDVVVVPGLAYTADGRRLGQGGGHFDRFLLRLRRDCVTIGVCFHEQVVADLPTSAHDVHVHHVVTDQA
jgi:5-formyltetrahydrofolate cyclo-ligase